MVMQPLTTVWPLLVIGNARPTGGAAPALRLNGETQRAGGAVT